MRMLLVMGMMCASTAHAQLARVAASERLGIEVIAEAGASWCASRPTFRVVAQRAATFDDPALAGLLQRVGAVIVAGDCPAAQAIDLTGAVYSDAVPWRATASAADGWLVHVERGRGPVDLDAPPPAAAAGPGATPVPVSADGSATLLGHRVDLVRVS